MTARRDLDAGLRAVLAVAAAEEGDRRLAVLDATARDVDRVDHGALVEDLDGLLEQLASEWDVVGDGDGPGEHVMAVST